MVQLAIIGKSKTEVAIKLLAYSALYGLFLINWIDLFGSKMPAYHLWLTMMYFAPFLPLLLLYNFRDWELVIALGLIASLMNDLFYYPVGMILFGIKVDLLEWYKWQLGFYGNDAKWVFRGGIIEFKVTSIIMGTSIYARIIASVILTYWWYRKKHYKLTKLSAQV